MWGFVPLHCLLYWSAVVLLTVHKKYNAINPFLKFLYKNQTLFEKIMDLLSSIHSNIVFSLEIIKWKNYPEWSLFNLCSHKKKKKKKKKLYSCRNVWTNRRENKHKEIIILLLHNDCWWDWCYFEGLVREACRRYIKIKYQHISQLLLILNYTQRWGTLL